MGDFSVDLSSVTLISRADLDALDLGTAIQLVQGQRAALLEEQLRDQLKEIQDRNRRIDSLNTTLSNARDLTAQFGEKDGESKKISDIIEKQRKELADTDEWKQRSEAHKLAEIDNNKNQISDLKKILKSSKADLSKVEEALKIEQSKSPDKATREMSYGNYLMKAIFDRPNDPLVQEFWRSRNIEIDAEKQLKELEKFEAKDLEMTDLDTKAGSMWANMQASAKAANMKIDIKDKGELKVLVENIKSMIDSLSNSQQLDMLRLQSYTSKYNETFEVRTNMIKKEHDINSSINANTRSS